MLRTLISYSLLALLGSAAAGQISVVQSGAKAPVLVVKVKDPDGRPVPGAIIRLAQQTVPSPADSNGEATFDSTPGSTFSLAVEAAGYYPGKLASVEVVEGETTTVVVEMRKAEVVTEIVVVTATGTAAELQETPIRTEVITTTLADHQVKTTLAEAFQATVSGVRVEMNCQNCGFMQIRMNGLEGPYTQILEDGMPTYSGVTAVYGLEQIPAAFLEQIEVVKGGNSALYGPGAVAGVINLIRREPRDFRAMSAHTLSEERQLLQLSVRRLMILLRKVAMERGMVWTFENNDERLRDGVRATLEALLRFMFERGAFAGRTPQEAFRVVTDGSVNTRQSIDQGRFIAQIQVAPSEPMEFITVLLSRASDGVLLVAEA